MRIQLTDNEVERFSRPIRGQGGFQDLLRRIQGGIDHATNVLDVSDADAERLVRYSFEYGAGGFQGRTEPTARRVPDTDVETDVEADTDAD